MSLACPFCYAVIKEENVNDFTEKPEFVNQHRGSMRAPFSVGAVRLSIVSFHIRPYFFLYLYG